MVSDDLGDFDLNLDWECLGLREPATTCLATQTTQLQGVATEAVDTRTTCIQDLSTLALHIDGVFRQLPPDPSLHMPKDGVTPEVLALWSARYPQRQCLEQLFGSAQRLLDVYPNTMDILFHKPVVEECQDANCIHQRTSPAEHSCGLPILAHLADNVHKPILFDTFILNLLLTCHMRIVDVLDSILIQVTTCAKITHAAPNMREAQLHIPELKIGDFVASPESSSSMQVVLLVHMASVLSDRVKQLNTKIVDALASGTPTKQGSMFKLQCEILVETSEAKVIALHKIRDALIEMGYMR